MSTFQWHPPTVGLEILLLTLSSFPGSGVRSSRRSVECSKFAEGWPGAGLLLQRVLTGMILFYYGASHLLENTRLATDLPYVIAAMRISVSRPLDTTRRNHDCDRWGLGILCVLSAFANANHSGCPGSHRGDDRARNVVD